MADNQGGGARKAVSIILIVVGAANIAYAVYRLFEGREGSLPLIGVGIMTAALGAVFLTTGK